MNNLVKTLSMLIIIIPLFNQQAIATDIFKIYLLAETNDPQYRQAVSTYLAALEANPQARAQLLPFSTLSGNSAHNYQSIDSAGSASNDVDFTTYGYSLNITQPLFHWERFIALRQAKYRIQQAQAEFSAAQQALMLRVAERYFDVLSARDNLRFAEAEKEALQRQLEQTNQQFEVGSVAITDVHEAKAGFNRAQADVILTENSLDNSREALREIIGKYVKPLSSLNEYLPLSTPSPEEINTWTEKAQVQNLQVLATQHALANTYQEIKKNQSSPSTNIRYGAEPRF